MEPLMQTLVATVKSMNDSLSALKEIHNLSSKLSTIESLLDRLVTSNENMAASNTQLADMMGKAWSNYDEINKAQTVRAKRVRRG